MEEDALRIPSQGESENHRVTFDTAKEMKSPRFRAIMRATSGRKRRHQIDVKSYSHDLNSKGPLHYPYMLQQQGGAMDKLKIKFSRLKKEVDSELEIFAGDLIELLEKKEDLHPKRREAIEDLLIMARECAEVSADEFWSKCEAIVQNLDDRRQELQMGTVKQAHTRMLFILTRCTRLLQFYKDGAPPLVDHVLGLHQFSDLGVYPGSLIVKSHTNLNNLMPKERILKVIPGDNVSPSTRDRMSSWRKFPSSAKKSMEPNQSINDHEKETRNNQVLKRPPKIIVGSMDSSSSVQEYQFGNLDEEIGMICRICDLRIPKAHAEEHCNICAIANKCDMKGLSVNERLERVYQVLQKMLDSWPSKNLETLPLGHDLSQVSSSYDTLTVSQDKDSFTGSEVAEHFEFNHLKHVKINTLSFSKKEDQLADSPLVASSTIGSHAQSPASTGQYNHMEFLTNDSVFLNEGNFQQVLELLDIVQFVLNINADDYCSLDFLHACLEDLQETITYKTEDGLIVETFGRRIEKLLREKYAYILQLIDDGHIDSTSARDTNDSHSEAVPGKGSCSSQICSNLKDRTSIEDFEIIKPISRGAFGRVFLAKKRVTGDLFAIKVLKKTNMIRKNAVESILAERNILISVRHPFVVRFFYSFTCRENLYLVMEYLNGGDLYSLLRSLGCLDEDMARTYIAEVVLALEYLHSLNVIHRDLKPDNLLIAHNGHIKLTDFGLSKVGLINSTDGLSGPDVSNSSMLLEPDSETHYPERNPKGEQREKQSVVGTPDYLAPEILLGMPHGPTADWWSVGIILYELLVGIPPFNADHPQKIFDNIMNRKIVWPSIPDEMSHEAYDLINKFLIENPHQRLGATGSLEVKRHPFFKSINWAMLAEQKAAFIPSTEGEDDTSYFTSRHAWNSTPRSLSEDCDNGCDSCSMSCDSSPGSLDPDEEEDECRSMADFGNGGAKLSVKYSFSNFSFKNLSQLATMNYDVIMKSNNSSTPISNSPNS
ncbi:putative serine/threonine protein kinase IRE [Wolffia australiana]